MKKEAGWLKKVFIGPNEYHKTMTSPQRYRRFRRTLFLVMTAVFLVPLILTTMLSYFEYRSQMLANLRWNAESAKKTMESFLSEFQTIIAYTVSGQKYDELLDPTNLNQLFQRLKSSYPGIVDIGIIDHNAAAGSDAAETGKTLHRIDPGRIIEDLQGAGFVLEDTSGVLGNPDDDLTALVFKPELRWQSDRSVLRFRKPL